MKEPGDAAKVITTPTQQGIEINSRTVELDKTERKVIKVDDKPALVPNNVNTKKKRGLIGMKCPKKGKKSAQHYSPVLPQESTNITAEQVIHNNEQCPCNTIVAVQQDSVEPLQRRPKNEMTSQHNIIEPENHYRTEDMNHNVEKTTSLKIGPRFCCHCESSLCKTIMPPEQPCIEYVEPMKMTTVINTSMAVSSGVLQSVSSRENVNSTPLPQENQHEIKVPTSRSGKLKDTKSKTKVHHGKKAYMKRSYITHSVIAIQSRTIISQTLNKSDGGSFEICIIGVKVDQTSFKNLM